MLPFHFFLYSLSRNLLIIYFVFTRTDTELLPQYSRQNQYFYLKVSFSQLFISSRPLSLTLSTQFSVFNLPVLCLTLNQEYVSLRREKWTGWCKVLRFALYLDLNNEWWTTLPRYQLIEIKIKPVTCHFLKCMLRSKSLRLLYFTKQNEGILWNYIFKFPWFFRAGVIIALHRFLFFMIGKLPGFSGTILWYLPLSSPEF